VTNGHETETIRAALIEGVRIGGRGFFVDYGDAAEQALNALRDAAVLYQAEWDIERKRADENQQGWDVCAELLEAAGADYQEALRERDEWKERAGYERGRRDVTDARLRELGQLAKNARALADIPGFDRAAMRDVLRAILDAALAEEKS
jgi:hypothetical protein